jgi:hypothetical protein
MCKVNREALSSLATQVDVSDVLNLYQEFFSTNQDGEADSLVNEAQLSINFATAVEGADPGVEFESNLSPEKLGHSLGFIRELPLLFNPLRHKAGLSPWSHPAVFDTKSGSDLEPLKLYWHQLAGVHAVVRMNFSKEKSLSRCNGTLIADEVGLGKTFIATTVMVFLSDLFMRQSSNLPLPPIISLFPLQLFR